MNPNKLPCFYYPTITTVIDDDEIFLENLVKNLSDRIPYQQFDTPLEALEFFQNQHNQKTALSTKAFFLATDSSFDSSTEHGKYAINLNLTEIQNKLYNQGRFAIPSVVVVDHDMPGMSGIEFCQKLIDYPIKKIMLTGVADHKIAINAFNEGIIHQFISKDDPNIFESIDAAILSMQKKYFLDLSDLIVKSIIANTHSFLENKCFVDFLWDFIHKNEITEFYLIDPVGSFLMLNTKGEVTWFVVKSNQEIQNDCEIAAGQNAAKNLIQTLMERKKLLFLFSEEDYKQPVEKWMSYLYPANKLEGIEGCYYSIIQGESACEIAGVCGEKIFSYNRYLKIKNNLGCKQ